MTAVLVVRGAAPAPHAFFKNSVRSTRPLDSNFAAFDLIRIVGEADILDHGAALTWWKNASASDPLISVTLSPSASCAPLASPP